LSLYTVCTEAAEQVYRTYSSCSVNSVQHYLLIKHTNMYLVFPALVSKPASLLVTNTISVFNYIALSFAHIRSWCVPLTINTFRSAHNFLMIYSTSKLKSNVDKASPVADYSKKNVSDNCEIVSLSRNSHDYAKNLQ